LTSACFHVPAQFGHIPECGKGPEMPSLFASKWLSPQDSRLLVHVALRTRAWSYNCLCHYELKIVQRSANGCLRELEEPQPLHAASWETVFNWDQYIISKEHNKTIMKLVACKSKRWKSHTNILVLDPKLAPEPPSWPPTQKSSHFAPFNCAWFHLIMSLCRGSRTQFCADCVCNTVNTI
jgi:hypothetical protein